VTKLLFSFTVTLSALLVATLALPHVAFSPPPEVAWLGAITAKKTALARAIAVHKIVIVGGSSSLFGINAEQIETATGIPTVNLATHLRAGPAYQLYKAREVLRSGDLVILALEYGALSPVNDAHPILLRQILYFDLGYLLERPSLLGLVMFGWPLSEAITGLTRAQASIAWPYRVEAITDHGDIDWSGEQEPSETARVAEVPPFAPAMPQSSAGLDALHAFLRYCEQSQVRVIYTWPNLVEKPEYLTERYTKYFADLIAFFESIGVPVVGRPEDALFSLANSLDTEKHPRHAGSFVRTARLIASLREEVNSFRR
jgi:hypothetical protein